MNRADVLIRQLSLRPHPEGGWYSEIFRSTRKVAPDDGRGTRSALTTIYFLLTGGSRSCLHRVSSDEVWHFHEGAPLTLLTCDPDFDRREETTLGLWDGVARPVHVVPAGHWQAAQSTGEYTLAACTVGPGFDFTDFSMLRDDPAAAARLRQRHADLEVWI
jgi:predicted cupin superfamily sugar epimerase